MKRYQAVDENGDLMGDPVEAESVREACFEMGLSDVHVQSNDTAVCWVSDSPVSVAEADD